MQSTGHSSMHALSSTSTQGCVMMYVTSELLFRLRPGYLPGVPIRCADSCLRQDTSIAVTSIGLSGGITAPGPGLRIADYQPKTTAAGRGRAGPPERGSVCFHPLPAACVRRRHAL